MIVSLWVGRQGAPSKVGFDHVGDDGTRLGEVEGGDGRIHLVETFAAAQQFGIDRADLVEHLLQLAEVGEELGDLGTACRQWALRERWGAPSRSIRAAWQRSPTRNGAGSECRRQIFF